MRETNPDCVKLKITTFFRRLFELVFLSPVHIINSVENKLLRKNKMHRQTYEYLRDSEAPLVIGAPSLLMFVLFSGMKFSWTR